MRIIVEVQLLCEVCNDYGFHNHHLLVSQFPSDCENDGKQLGPRCVCFCEARSVRTFHRFDLQLSAHRYIGFCWRWKLHDTNLIWTHRRMLRCWFGNTCWFGECLPGALERGRNPGQRHSIFTKLHPVHMMWSIYWIRRMDFTYIMVCRFL